MPGPCAICKVTGQPMVKNTKGQLTFACPRHYLLVTGNPQPPKQAQE